MFVQRIGRLGAPLSVVICTRVLKKHVLGLLFAMLLNAQQTMLSLEVPRADYVDLFAEQDECPVDCYLP